FFLLHLRLGSARSFANRLIRIDGGNRFRLERRLWLGLAELFQAGGDSDAYCGRLVFLSGLGQGGNRTVITALAQSDGGGRALVELQVRSPQKDIAQRRYSGLRIRAQVSQGERYLFLSVYDRRERIRAHRVFQRQLLE